MNIADQTRWSVVVPKDLDRDLRVFLAENGMKKGDLSKYIEESVRWNLLRETVAEVRRGFEDLSAEDAQALVDEACAAVRKDMRPSSKRPT